MTASELRDQLDALIAEHGDCQVYGPSDADDWGHAFRRIVSGATYRAKPTHIGFTTFGGSESGIREPRGIYLKIQEQR